MANLVIKDLYASVNGVQILKGINLELNTNEIHALLGPNGHGKSTLLGVLMGNPKYTVDSGEIYLNGENLLEMTVDQRSKKGLFLGMQYPQEIPGVTVSDFLKVALNAHNEKPVSLFKYIKELEKASKEVNLPFDMVHRFINEGFSGGEKKRNEILQMLVLKPKIAMLDEIDSGLDVDALKVIGNAINKMKDESQEFSCLIVSHYARMYELVKPTHVHVIVNGRVVTSGDYTIVEKIDKQGYDWIKSELGIEIQKEVAMNTVSIGTCATKALKK
jgi:Fe-S cluster assembly ATP-binding protein